MKKMFTRIGLILLLCGIITGMFSCWEMPEMQYGVVKVGFNLNNTKAITYDWEMVEIQQLKHDNSVFTREAKASITKIACKVRSGDDEEYPGIEITGVPFYTKTIRIEH